MLYVEDFGVLNDFMNAGTDGRRLAGFQALLQSIIKVEPEEDPMTGIVIFTNAAGMTRMVEVDKILPLDLVHVKDEIARILSQGDPKLCGRVDWRLIARRWAIYPPEDIEGQRWSSAAQPTTGGFRSDKDIIWTTNYPSEAVARLGTMCAALEAETQRGSPLGKFEEFAASLRQASTKDLAQGLDLLPDPLKGATTVVESILKNLQMADVVKLQEMLLGDRWRVHGLVQGRALDEWRCTMTWGDGQFPGGGAPLRARSGKCADPVIAVMLAVLKARLIDKGLLLTDRPEAA